MLKFYALHFSLIKFGTVYLVALISKSNQICRVKHKDYLYINAIVICCWTYYLLDLNGLEGLNEMVTMTSFIDL